MQRNVVGWFEVPVLDIDRATKFYETVLDIKLERHQMGGFDMAWFPMLEGDKPGAAGTLVKNDAMYKPSTEGILVYFTSHSGDLDNELGRVEAAGGKVLSPKEEIGGGYGFMALLTDTEGNRVALHSMK